MISITVGGNSFISESELYTHLTRRLNGGEFTYLMAVEEAGANNPSIAQVFDEMRGATLAEIETALINSGITYSIEAVTQAYNLLATQQTSIQIKNAQALILATQLIDEFDFIGKPTLLTQPLRWPRVDAIDRNGVAIADDTIPAGVKTATAELTYFLLQHDMTDPTQYQAIYLLTYRGVGQSQSAFGKRASQKLPANVMDSLKPFLIEKSGFSSTLIF